MDSWNGDCRPRQAAVARDARAAAKSSSLFFVVALLVGAGIAAPQAATAAPSGWYVASVPGTGSNDIVLGSTCANAQQCWAVGVTLNGLGGGSPSSVSPLVEAWNGSTWTLVPVSLPAGVTGGGFFDATCVNGADCWAVGAEVATSGNGNPTGTLTEHWDGTGWSVVPSPSPSGPGVAGAILSGVSCVSASSCVAVGYATDDTGANLTNVIEQWNGTSWTIVPGAATGQAFDQLNAVQCLSTSNCWAAGNAGPAQQNSNFLPIFPGAAGDRGLIEHWDGSAWSVVPSATEAAPTGGYLSAVACTSANGCWASGATTDTSGSQSGILMEHWNGSSWADVSASVPDSTAPGILAGISCVSAAQCWAVGSTGTFGNGSTNLQSVVENWNGSAWSVQPSPDVTALSFLDSVACVPAVGCLAGGSTVTSVNGDNNPGFRAYIEQTTFPPASSQGTLLVARDGGVFAYGTAPFDGSLGGQRLNAPVVGVAATPDGQGYWLVGSDGGVFAFGDAPFDGSMGGQHLNTPIVGIAPTADGRGYWLVASDGGVFSFGDAGFHGSMGGIALNAAVVGIGATDHGGYWLVASDGGVFSFGGAAFYGSAGGTRLNAPVTGMAATADGQGYWLVGSDGGVFTYGNAAYLGSVPGQGIIGQPPVVGVACTPSGQGYWLVGANGAVYAYGDATFLGAPNAARLVAPVAGIASA